jgi:hypothetical protein
MQAGHNILSTNKYCTLNSGRGGPVRAPASYPGGSRLKPRLEDGLISNVVVDWLTILLHIREFPASDLGPETGYDDRFSWVTSLAPGNTVRQIRPRPLPSTAFPIHHLLITIYFDAMVRATEKASSNKLQINKY